MLDGVPILATTIGLIGIFLYIFANLQLSDVRANWNERRCEPFVVAIAQLVPTDPKINPSDFSAENFQFCLSKLIDASIALFMTPAMGVFNSQVNAVGPIKNSMNYLTTSANTLLLQPLNDMFQGLWDRVKIFMFQIIRIFEKIHSSFDRVFTIAVSSIFAGIGVYKTITNLLKLVIIIILVIMAILMVIMIFASYILAPVMPIIMTTIAVIAASSLLGEGMVGGGDSFCVKGDTLVAVPGGWKPVSSLQPGDELREGYVEGVLKTVGTGACVSIDGIVISKIHLVNYNGWIQAGNHPLAQPVETPEYLYCLNTSTRKWIVKGETELEIRDWEELPEGFDNIWDSLVYYMLNGNTLNSHGDPYSRGTLPANTLIVREGKEVLIDNIQIGDFIQDAGSRLTKVLGVYRDSICDMSSLWIMQKGVWDHFDRYSSGSGYQLITSSGTFVASVSKETMLLRDFTEVGVDRIHETYPFTENLLALQNSTINRNGEKDNIPN